MIIWMEGVNGKLQERFTGEVTPFPLHRKRKGVTAAFSAVHFPVILLIQ